MLDFLKRNKTQPIEFDHLDEEVYTEEECLTDISQFDWSDKITDGKDEEVKTNE